jgi:hypothetical protein
MRSDAREIRWVAVVLAGLTVFSLSACKEHDQVEFDTPVVSTVDASDIWAGRVNSGGEVTCNLCAFISNRGVVWAKTPAPTVELATKTRDGTGIGTFVSSVGGLERVTTYYLRAYATSSDGTWYGNEVTFSTPAEIARVQTTSVYNITSVSAVCSADVTDDGGAPVTARGVVWSTSLSNLSFTLPTRTSEGTGTGSFTSNITGLAPNTTYYVRAYATNSVGTTHGLAKQFTTGE